MKGFIAAFAFCFAQIPQIAQADAFRYLAKGSDNDAVFLDETAVAHDADKARAWLVTIKSGYITGKSDKPAYYTLRMTFNCSTQKSHSDAISFYDGSGKVLTADIKGSDGDDFIEPGNLDYDAYKIVCGLERSSNPFISADDPLSLSRSFRAAVQKKQ